MKIYSVTDYDTTFVYTTLGWSVENLPKFIKNCEVKMYPYTDMKERRIEPDSGNDVFFIFEIGNPQHCGLKTADLRKWFPNAKFITFCSDTIYYQMNGDGKRWQMDPEGIDVHLEIMPQSLERFLDNGIDAELWMWTGSEKLFKEALIEKALYGNEPKVYDFIGVYGHWSIDNIDCWRHHAVNYIRSKGWSFTGGGGNGHQDKDLIRLFRHYINSWFTLGTTSHNRPELTKLGCMKGFRDWLGPILGNVLLYDDHPNITLHTYNKERRIVPTYQYDDFESILRLAGSLRVDTKLYDYYLKEQTKWAWDNTIERQLVNIMLKKNWITGKDLEYEFI